MASWNPRPAPTYFAGAQPVPGMKMQRGAVDTKADWLGRDPKLEQIGFEVVEPTPGCCECESLSTKGIVAVIALAICAPCFSCVPCCMQECHEQQQRPVFAKEGERREVTWPHGYDAPYKRGSSKKLVTGIPTLPQNQ